jgi:rhodanese-related sulfurtransferase
MRQPIRTRRLIAMAVALAGIGTALAAQDQKDDELASAGLRIAWSDFKPLYDRGDLVLVDVRDALSFESGHIPGARSIPLTDIESRVEDLRRLKKPVVLYCACSSEHTAAIAARALQQKGLTAHALTGGYTKWYQETDGRIERGKPPRR